MSNWSFGIARTFLDSGSLEDQSSDWAGLDDEVVGLVFIGSDDDWDDFSPSVTGLSIEVGAELVHDNASRC